MSIHTSKVFHHPFRTDVLPLNQILLRKEFTHATQLLNYVAVDPVGLEPTTVRL